MWHYSTKASSTSPLRLANPANLYPRKKLYLWQWFIALLIVGQVFQHFAFQLIGGVSRNDPFSGPLLGFYGVTAFLILNRIFRLKGFLNYLGQRGSRTLAISFLLGIVLIIGLVYTPAPRYGLIKTIGYFAFNIGPSLLILLIIQNEQDIFRLMRAVLIIGILGTLVVILATIELSGSLSGIGDVWQTKKYFYVLGTKADLGIWFGRRMSLLMVTAMVLAQLLYKRKYRRMTYLLVPAFGYLVMLAGARGPFYFGMLAAAIVAYLLSRSPLLKQVFVFFSIVIVIFIIGKNIFYKPMGFNPSYLPVPIEVQERYGTPLENPEGSWAIRLDSFKSAANVFMENVLIGIGTGGWPYVHHGFDFRDYPHNIFLEIGSELGLSGLIIFCAFLLFIYRDAIVSLAGKNKNSALYLFAVWGIGITLIGFLNAQVSGDIFGNEYLWVGAAILSKVATWVDIRKKFNNMIAFSRVVDSGQDFHQSKLTENLTHR